MGGCVGFPDAVNICSHNNVSNRAFQEVVVHNKNSSSVWLKSLVAGAAMAAAATLHATPVASPSPAVLPVTGYTLSVNGPTGWYGYDDAGGELTDGLKGMTVGGGYWNWSPYVLWSSQSPTITFNLGEVRSVGSIIGHFLAYPGAGVTLPKTATVSFSDDGVTFGPAIVQALWDGTPLINDTPVELSLLASPGQGRYVSVTLETPGHWFALSEVTLLAPVPEPEGWALLAAGLGVLATLRLRRSPRA